MNCPCAHAATRRRPGCAGSGDAVWMFVYRRRVPSGPASSSRSELDAPSTNLKLEIDSTVQSPRGSRRLPPSARHWLRLGRFLVLFVARDKKYGLSLRRAAVQRAAGLFVSASKDRPSPLWGKEIKKAIRQDGLFDWNKGKRSGSMKE